jgi:excisionase family DNA binding protein
MVQRFARIYIQIQTPSETNSEGWRMMQLLTIKVAAEKLAVSPDFLKKLQRQGRLKVVRLGKAVRVSEQELERLCREEFNR